MRTSVTGELVWAADAAGLRAALGYESARDALEDPRGWTVRCTPRRRTRVLRLDEPLFAKLRSSAPEAAAAEWGALERLDSLGIDSPRPVFRARRGRASVLGIRPVAGRPADAWLAEELRRGGRRAVEAWLVGRVAPVVRRLHGAGLFHRDLYWNHVFVGPDGEVALIDVERVFAPRSRSRRWLVKDLAGLVSSWPGDQRLLLESLFVALEVESGVRDAAVAKARQIRGRRPKYGD